MAEDNIKKAASLMGKKGGEEVKSRYGKRYFSDLGKKSGESRRRKKEEKLSTEDIDKQAVV